MIAINTDGLFVVDVEATSATPETGVMTEFGVVEVGTMDWFHGHLWDFVPDPDLPVRPIHTAKNPGYTVVGADSAARRTDTKGEAAVFTALSNWLALRTDGRRALFISDNPAFDFMWVAQGFDRARLNNPFGFSARRIGDFAAGLERDWRKSTQWKKLRRTRHDHNPVNDARGNAEALLELLKRAGER